MTEVTHAFIFYVYIYHDDQSERCSKQSEQHLLIFFNRLKTYCMSLIWVVVKDERRPF